MDRFLPWTRSCFVCGEANARGLHLRSRYEDGRVVIDYTPDDSDRGYRELMHGGIGMTLLDEAMTWAAIVHAKRICVAAEMSTRFKQPVRIGRPLRVEGWVVEQNRRLLRTEGTLRDTGGTLLMQAGGKYMPMAESEGALCRKDFVCHPAAVDPSALLGPGKDTPPP